MADRGDSSDWDEWDEYFMAIALFTKKHSKDPNTQVGACIVNNEKKIVGIGYNRMPTRCEKYSWSKLPRTDINSKQHYVCHAEMNAILNKYSRDLKDCKIYVSLFPCNECAKLIIESGIKTVIYVSDKKAHKVKTKAAKRMFNTADVKTRLFPRKPPITIHFHDTEDTQMN